MMLQISSARSWSSEDVGSSVEQIARLHCQRPGDGDALLFPA